MPIFFQHQVNESTKLGIWKIEENESYFKGNVPQHRDVTHPHKRLQHLAGRFLLQYLFPDFPYELIQIADTRKPYLADEQYHFSISHCGDFAAAIVSREKRVGVDIEIPVPKIEKIANKFLRKEEFAMVEGSLPGDRLQLITLFWSAKEAVFKWYRDGGVDFKEHIHLDKINESSEIFECNFLKTKTRLDIHYRLFDQVNLAWVTN